MRKVLILSIMLTLIVACSPEATSDAKTEMGMGPGGMSDRHHKQIPEDYAEERSPQVNEGMLTSGAEVYNNQCASCHGDEGMGNGPAGQTLDIVPAPVAHTSQMLSDAYLFWRTNEGGADFGSTMPAWKDVLTEEEIWSVIAYIRALGRGEAVQIHNMQHEQMLAQAVEQNLISQKDADTFSLVHDAMDAYHDKSDNELPLLSMDEVQAFILDELVKAGDITQFQAEEFARIHRLLLDVGLMQ